jgi:hypothetical protein
MIFSYTSRSVTCPSKMAEKKKKGRNGRITRGITVEHRDE